MCILSLLLGRLSRFIFWMRSLRCSEGRVILCIWTAVSSVAGWIWCLNHATGDGRLFNHSAHLSRRIEGSRGLIIVSVKANNSPSEQCWRKERTLKGARMFVAPLLHLKPRSARGIVEYAVRMMEIPETGLRPLLALRFVNHAVRREVRMMEIPETGLRHFARMLYSGGVLVKVRMMEIPETGLRLGVKVGSYLEGVAC
jgi:hypothetical protein